MYKLLVSIMCWQVGWGGGPLKEPQLPENVITSYSCNPVFHVFKSRSMLLILSLALVNNVFKHYLILYHCVNC